MLDSGVKENVLPQIATAMVNFRILQGDSVAGVTAHVNKIVDKVKRGFDTPGLSINVSPEPISIEPTAVSSLKSGGYEAIVKTVGQVLEDEKKIVIAPYVNNGSSDSRMYKILTPDVYGFYPIALTDELIDTMHGNNERVPVDGYILAIQYWSQLIKNTH
jgi:carboxypeptidase PM20D1